MCGLLLLCRSWDYSSFLVRWASHCGGFSLQSLCSRHAGFTGLSSWGSWALKCWLSSYAHRLSCSSACGTFPDQESNVPFIGRLDPSGSLRLLVFKARFFGGSSAQNLRVGMPQCETQILALQGNSHTFVILPNCGLWVRCGFSFEHLFRLPMSLLSFYPLL